MKDGVEKQAQATTALAGWQDTLPAMILPPDSFHRWPVSAMETALVGQLRLAEQLSPGLIFRRHIAYNRLCRKPQEVGYFTVTNAVITQRSQPQLACQKVC